MKVTVANRIPYEWKRELIVSLVREVENQLNSLSEGRIAARHFTATTSPTTGTFARGDIVWNLTPSAGGTIGWVCVTAGTPGTFKTWGAISA